LATTTGFFFTTIADFGRVDSSVGFLIMIFSSTGGSEGIFGLMTGAVERG